MNKVTVQHANACLVAKYLALTPGFDVVSVDPVSGRRFGVTMSNHGDVFLIGKGEISPEDIVALATVSEEEAQHCAGIIQGYSKQGKRIPVKMIRHELNKIRKG